MPFAPPPPPKPAETIAWLQQPTADDIARAEGFFAPSVTREGKAVMTCYVLADGRLEACRTDLDQAPRIYQKALLSLKDRFRLDMTASPRAKVDVSVTFPKLQDAPPKQLSAPSAAEAKAALPTAEGAVDLRCRLTSRGVLEACTAHAVPKDDAAPVRKEDEASASAALPLAGRFRFTPPTLNGRPTDVYVVASVASGHAITNPDWVRKPTGDDLSSFYPQVAWASGLSGKAVVQCSVMANGGLKDCLILEESPRGIGFGDALLRMTDKFQMRPQVIDGKPVEGGTVVIPVHFEPPDNVPKVTPDSSGSFKVLPWAPWIEAPTAADVAAAFPPRALASRTFGSGALRCRFKPDGHLTECEQTLDGAPNTAFNEAVKRLAPKFRANLESLKPFGLGRFRIAISVTFSERALRPAAERYVRQPEWLRSPDADAVLQAFPDRAVQAGVLTGKAVVDCLIGATGMLEGCATKSQEPDGLDFGLSGEKVASLMQANLWTNDGEAAPGQHVLLPIRFIYRPAKSDSAAAPASKPGA